MLVLRHPSGHPWPERVRRYMYSVPKSMLRILRTQEKLMIESLDHKNIAEKDVLTDADEFVVVMSPSSNRNEAMYQSKKNGKKELIFYRKH